MNVCQVKAFRPNSYLYKDVLKAGVVDQEFIVHLPLGVGRVLLDDGLALILIAKDHLGIGTGL